MINSVNNNMPKIPAIPSNPADAQPVRNIGGETFMDYLKAALDGVNELQNISDRSAKEFMAGLTDNIHQVMIDGEKAELALQFTMQIRNKILDAYSEIMRMQI